MLFSVRTEWKIVELLNPAVEVCDMFDAMDQDILYRLDIWT